MDRNGPITVIRVPPDNCPNCKREACAAHRALAGFDDAITADYRCPDCDFVWDTTWRIQPIMSTEYEDDGTTHTLACGCEFCEAIRREDESG